MKLEVITKIVDFDTNNNFDLSRRTVAGNKKKIEKFVLEFKVCTFPL